MFRNGDILENKYKIVKKIGRGSFGVVYEVESVVPPPEQYALKILESANMNEELNVGLILGSQSPFLVKFKEVINKEDDQLLMIVMELCKGGDLATRIKQNPHPTDIEIYRFCYEASMAVKKIHDKGIVHRDIKPGNFFLVVKGGYKLGDYGLARTLESLYARSSFTMVGTNGYTAPEVLKGTKYTAKIDIFSLGATLAEFILGYNPFASPDGNINLQRALDARPVDAALMHTHAVMKIALRMMNPDPAARPSIDDVLASPLPALAVLPALRTAAMAMESTAENEALRRELEEVRKERDILRQREKDSQAEKEKPDFSFLRKDRCPKCLNHTEIIESDQREGGHYYNECAKCGCTRLYKGGKRCLNCKEFYCENCTVTVWPSFLF